MVVDIQDKHDNQDLLGPDRRDGLDLLDAFLLVARGIVRHVLGLLRRNMVLVRARGSIRSIFCRRQGLLGLLDYLRRHVELAVSPNLRIDRMNTVWNGLGVPSNFFQGSMLSQQARGSIGYFL